MNPTARLLLLALLAGAPCAPRGAHAQDTPPRRLPPAAREAAEGLSSVHGLVELADGRLLVSDAKDAAVYLLDLERGTTALAARVGAGPKEYRRAGGLYRMRSGEIWMQDASAQRYLRFDGRGAPLGTRPFATAGGRFRVVVAERDAHVIDADGVEYASGRMGSPASQVGDSVPLVRRRADRADTLVWLRAPRPKETLVAEGARMFMPLLFAEADGFAVAADGRVAVVRASPYRVEWIERSGRRTAGPAYDHVPLPVTDADRAEVEARRRSLNVPGGIRIAQSDGQGGTRTVSAAELVPPPEYAPVKPPFVAAEVRLAPDSRVWVRRSAPHGAPAVYDIFDAAGMRLDRVELPPRTTLVGFGRGAVYVARADADDLLFIGRVAY